jgi:plastocyanin
VVDLFTPDRPTAISEQRLARASALRGGVVSRKFSRLVLVALAATGFGFVPMLGANAADPNTSSVDAYVGRFEVPRAAISNRLDIYVGDWVTWNVFEGEHTVTPIPADRKLWGSDGSGTLKVESERYTAKNFKTANNYTYYCTVHGSFNEATGKAEGMWGFIRVMDPNAATTTTTAAPVTTTTAAPTTTTRPATTTPTTAPTGAGTSGVPTPPTTAKAPTTTTGKDKDKDKGKKPKEEETTTTTTAPPPPAPIDLPDSAIIPSLPGSEIPASVQEGVVGEAPGDAPEGEAVALLKGKRGGNGKKLLIVSALGLGALGVGTAGYKFANRSSKYFPA